LGDQALYLVKSPTQQSIVTNETASFNLPSGIFRDSDPNAKVTVAATMADGSNLPEWLSFDPESGRFSAKPPKDSAGILDIKLIARDQLGNSVFTQFKLTIEESKDNALVPKNSGQPDDTTDSTGDKPVTDQSPVPPHSDLRDGKTSQKVVMMNTLKGRPSLAAQMAVQSQRGRDGGILKALESAVARKSKAA